MKLTAKFFYGKSKSPRSKDRVTIKGAPEITSALEGLSLMIKGTARERATRLEVLVTVTRRLTGK